MTTKIPQTRVFFDNKLLNFTPEKKLEEWKNIILEKVNEGCTVKLYADTETTGFEHSNRGRPVYDPVVDKKGLTRSSIEYGVPEHLLEKEAKEDKGKIDRMIEIAFVACYTNKNGESFPLMDKEGNQIYFHEMIDPYKESDIEESKRFKKMPLIPYEVHKTSFEFLRGNEEHPYLKLTLPRPAPSTYEVLKEFSNFFVGNKPENYDKIVLIFHNADEFDMPFINSEFKRAIGEGEQIDHIVLRNIVQVHDSLKIVKQLLPNPVQKLIAFSQFDEFFGGNPEIKNDANVAIQPTGKNLNNIIRIAKFLPELDLSKLNNYSDEKQRDFANQFKRNLLNDGFQVTDTIMSYYNKPSTDIDLSEGLEKDFISKNKTLIENYKKFRTSYNSFLDVVAGAKEYPEIYKSLQNVQKAMEEHKDLKENLYLLKNTPRDAHGAMVDSLLFMYSFNIIENSLYRNHKIVNEHKFDDVPLTLPDFLLKAYEDKKKVAENKIDDVKDLNKSERKTKLKI